MQEPPKAAQLQYEANPALVPARRAALVIQVPELGATVVEAVVDLSASASLLSWQQVVPCISSTVRGDRRPADVSHLYILFLPQAPVAPTERPLKQLS